MNNKTRKLVTMALFIALSFIGANIKFPGTTIAFDSMPAFLASMILGPIYGAVIGFIGHLITAATSGFPLTIIVHLIVAINMAITMIGVGYTYKWFSKGNLKFRDIVVILVGVVLNAPISTVMLIPVAGKGILAMIPPLAVAALGNILLALILEKVLPKKYFI
ncbi:ECF transporter S component [Clostridium senegalense]|uniref:ECF transporter S component n=1 Tax=Clostridium senegalense TaxID=1465809 RepID=A0A6M0H360_9CLOT|nr:ECF transporter S component [Clostridium senegalense]NEU05155.1 ECF transporter S component [Clostridium senegalense]